MVPQQTQIALEATGSYSDAVSLFLDEQGYVVSVLNPAVLVNYRKSINMRSKTDALDARLLARYAWEYRPRAWKPLPKELLTLRYLLARREDVQHMLQQERNRLHAGRMDAWIRSRVQQHSKQLDQELHLIWKRIQDHLKAHPSLKVVRVAVMRKLLHIVYGVWKHETDYDPTLAFPQVA